MNPNAAPVDNSRCPRCGGGFRCGAADPEPCPCSTLVLDAALQQRLRQQYTGCLCLACLCQLQAGAATSLLARP